MFLANMKRMGRRAGGLQRVMCDIAMDGHGTAEARCMRRQRCRGSSRIKAIRRQKIFAPTTRAFSCRKMNDCAALVMCVPWRSEL